MLPNNRHFLKHELHFPSENLVGSTGSASPLTRSRACWKPACEKHTRLERRGRNADDDNTALLLKGEQHLKEKEKEN
jgi:hypothetical protein